jgi:putative spermidine/putrescine transport system substrate-binding protein
MVKRIGVLMGLMLAASVLWAGGTAEREGTAPFEERYTEMSWEEIVAEAEGQELFFYMWGGDDSINEYVQGWVSEQLESRYDISLEMVPVSDASVYVNKVLGEKQAGRTEEGSVDAMWINGENFRTMREADLLFGPFADKLPNIEYVDREDPTVANDFGYPVEGYESPYGSAQFVMVYDSAKIPEPPQTVDALLRWIRNNPGRFTYPAPPDFTGSAFVRHLFYHVAGGYDQLLGPFDEETYNRVAPELWSLLNELEPHLWRSGDTYPESHSDLQRLFANGAVYFGMDYNPAGAANRVAQGRYPESTRTYVFDGGTIGNTHYVAIAFNSPHKAAAMVLANFLLSPEAQYRKMQPEVWGDLTALDIPRLPAEWQERFRNLPRPESVLSVETLLENRLPELQAPWLQAIEEGWRENVLQN